MNDWIECVEEPLRNLVKMLRDNGFNTTYSCAHLPGPSIQMEFYDDNDITRLFDILIENRYTRFFIRATWYWDEKDSRRLITVEFCPKMSLVDLKDITNVEGIIKH